MCDYIAGMTDRYAIAEHRAHLRRQTQIRVTVSSAGSAASNSATVFPCPGKINSGAISLNGCKHKPPQMRARMRQNQFRRIARFISERNQIQIQRARLVENYFWLRGQILFPMPAIFPAATPAFRPRAEPRPTTAFTNFGEPGGQSTGDVCQSEDLRIGASENFCSRAIASKMICRESPRFEPSATKASFEI